MKLDNIQNSLDFINLSINDFLSDIPEIEKQTFNKLLEITKDLEIQNGKIKNNVKNLKLIGEIKKELDKIILSKPYLKKVAKFTKAFDKVSDLQKEYFSSIGVEFGTIKTLDELKKINIDNTIELLTESGIDYNYTSKIRNILQTNITSGGSYSDLISQLKETEGKLLKYASTIATTSLNTYSRAYNQTVASDLGFKWYMYVGTNVLKTRPFCRAMTEKKYFHESEIPDIITGNIDGEIISLAGLNEATTIDNFTQLAGGWNCGHGIYPIPDAFVPKEIRDKLHDLVNE
jgi:hypothetical protein